MSVLNTLQYKQCLCILTLPKCIHNLQTKFSQFTDQKKSEMVKTIEIEHSKNGNTTRSQI